jgi:hypothetical protein
VLTSERAASFFLHEERKEKLEKGDLEKGELEKGYLER